MARDYNETVYLPRTSFEMRAGLPKKEPKLLADWQENRLYFQMVEHNSGKPRFVLHDGPPYANGNIHMGTAMNKIIKDVIVRYKNMSGWEAPYVPGYDCHGLPIELKALAAAGDRRKDISKLELRRICHEFATEHIDVMGEQFQRLGVLGDFADPYLTLRPEFEARQVEVFGEMAKRGYIYKGQKPVYWCPSCRTALAEAEIEYAEDEVDSIYVRFAITGDPNGVLAKAGIPADKAWVVIWTTTTWTLPSNIAVSVHPDYEYSFVKFGGGYHLMATELVKGAMEACHVEDYEIVGAPIRGSELELIEYRHPFLDRTGLLILGRHVTLESGTGCVHTAPAHGADDFLVCQNYPQLLWTVPVDDGGVFTEEGGKYAGLSVWAANPVILADIRESGHLVGVTHIKHQYPHCWRCHNPIIFRSTSQWFCSIDKFREEVYKAIDTVQWVPAWGRDRMTGMVRDRNDWCISRQRTWGVPIPVFYCKGCGRYHITESSIKAVSELFRREGSDAWYKYEASEILPAGESCSCGCTEFTKETDIMDVWFDSGSTHAAVLDERKELHRPAELYMEGGDQFRGWFQSSLLTSVATAGEAPYKAVVCHGWVVDEQGRQMHKSAGNGVEPAEIIKDYGADIIRLWVASSDYTVDVRVGKDILKQLSEAYRKMRNTARFMLSNLDGFDPARDLVPDTELLEIDRWALAALDRLTQEAAEGYESYNFSKVYHALYNFCVVDMSNFYLDVVKDRLYCTDGALRKAAQTAMYRILVQYTKLLAPILCFTSQEIWEHMPKLEGMKRYVVLEEIEKAGQYRESEAFDAKWNTVIAVRDRVKKALEEARAAKVIGSSLEAGVSLSCEGEEYRTLSAIPAEELRDLFIVSELSLVQGGEGVKVVRAGGCKCPRCWKYTASNREDGLCDRCDAVLRLRERA